MAVAYFKMAHTSGRDPPSTVLDTEQHQQRLN